MMMITVLLPNYKRRGAQVSCDDHRKRYPASRIGQSLEKGGAARAALLGDGTCAAFDIAS
jgi:hypothetical protein